MRNQSSPPRRPTGLVGATPASRSPDSSVDLLTTMSGIRQTTRRRERTAASMLKQDSIAEECSSRSPSPTLTTTALLPHSRHPSTGSQCSQSPRLENNGLVRTASRLMTSHSPTMERKGSCSPHNAIASSFNSSASTRRRGFQRAPSTAQSDVTDAQTTRPCILEPLHSCLSYENNSKIRFDISSSASSLRNSNSSSLWKPTATLPVPGAISGNGAGSLKANGFVPPSMLLSAGSARDPSRWHLCITKQRSQSESAFNNRHLHLPPGYGGISPTGSTGGFPMSYHHDQAGILTSHHTHSASLSGCPTHRRCSMTLLNPHKEQAILRRILGPNALDWLKDNRLKKEKSEQQSKKSLSVLSDDLEGQRNIDDAKTPLVKDNEKGGRLIKRQYLYEVRRATSDYALFFAVIGIVMMVIENELSAAHVYEKDSVLSILFKIIIVLSTGILILLVIKFHVHEVQLFMNANSAEDWRIALTWERCLQIAVELAVCSICPVPFNYDFLWTTVHSDGITVTSTWVSLDVALSIPMFFRIYWIFRVMLLHSRLFTDASSRSIAGLNRVNFNSRFILKTLMTICPGTMLLVFTASMWVMVAWILRQCERHHAGDPPISMHALKHQNYLNSLWFIAITFLSVGYGDIVPNTYCGRGMAVITGVLGTCTSSMVVAVIARKLELTRAEKHVHNFMMDTQLTKQLKHAAANVLRETWLIYKYRRLVEKIDPTKIRHHQRKFLVAIYALRKVKRDQRKLAENSVSLGDVAKTTSNTHEMIHDIHSIQEGLAVRMTSVEHQLSDIQREIGSLSELLRSQYQRRPSGNDRDSDLISVDSVRRRKHTMQQDTSYQ
ncbi:unnamed protein product [Bursaphelenchus xylophilus]|uniref:(pine wood nematode) hypothetical protein n=1 Tax=Bursaphelenchus xylophilus TaxID=6326 RepID=A0A1I7RKU9_BURXY|nr:unnamed protein product [Bursaphelenchus xylophilus]CAG9083862.1 unnamed protein product [Bursaphelenchus xylophilus]